MLCAVDDTWVDLMEVYKAELAKHSPWDSVVYNSGDMESLLSSPELMDPKTDSSANWKAAGSISGYFARPDLPNVASFNKDQILDVVDVLMAKETLYLRGRSLFQSILTFPYLLRLHELKAKCPVLHCYVRCVLRTLNLVVRAIGLTSIRDEEEFTMLPPELDTLGYVPIAELLEEIDAVIATLSDHAALSSRFVFRRRLLEMFSYVYETGSQLLISAAVATSSAAVQTLNTHFVRTAGEPVEDPVLFHGETHAWITSLTPVSRVPTPSFADATETWRSILTQLAPLSDPVTTVQGGCDFVEAFSAKKPLLFTRALAMMMLFGEDPMSQFLNGGPLFALVLETLAVVHGAPIYGKVVTGDEETLKDLALYHGRRQNFAQFRAEAQQGMQQWLVRMTRCLLLYWESLLCNRGRAHRRLMNLLEGELVELLAMSLHIDTHIFKAQKHTTPPGAGRHVEQQLVVRASVLGVFVQDFVFQVQANALLLMVELDLFAKAEWVAALSYIAALNGFRLENLNALYLTTSQFIPEHRKNPRTGVPLHNPTLATRNVTSVPPQLRARIECTRHLNDAVMRAVRILNDKGLIDLSMPPHSLTQVDVVFHNRLRAFGRYEVNSGMTFSRLMAAAKASDLVDQTPEQVLSLLARSARSISDRAKPLTASAVPGSTRDYFVALEKAARSLFVSLNLLATLDDDSKRVFDVVVEPSAGFGLMTVALKRKVTASASS